ncbi:MAG: hypothetical protein UW32_C0001G0025 [Candidatus Wolfebacteria bacterium GW2011_GWE2_44_13]|uniref:Uncharacterized protein n=1 Tax=Candidatus Wolfebacteria bacterium GW2011_GWE2_44_13 TaxID=1619017 RepID=A0A0G1HA59_9BACT|nr:MAG: hypothetical protein UW32_C0001G0025 [Candidatus Wolfebacteria bacterium GW2011_GWE2_44_13]
MHGDCRAFLWEYVIPSEAVLRGAEESVVRSADPSTPGARKPYEPRASQRIARPHTRPQCRGLGSG